MNLSRGKVVRKTTHRFESSSVTSSPPSSLHSSSSSRCGGLDEYNPTNDRPSGLPRRFRESLVCPDSPHTLTLMSDSGLLMAFGIGEATTRTSSSIQPYQGIFVFLGCVSLAFVPLIWFMMPNSPDYRKGHQARRRPTHRDWAISGRTIPGPWYTLSWSSHPCADRRLQASKWKLDQFREAMRDPKTWM